MVEKTKICFRSLINRSSQEIYDWHLRESVIERCIPPSEKIAVICSTGRPNHPASKVSVRFKVLNLFWVNQALEYDPHIDNESFSLHQTSGVFDEYKYETVITPQSTHTAEIIDKFEFTHRLPSLFNPIINHYLKRRIGKLLSYKHELIDHDIGMIQKYLFEKPFKILISGSHGLIGKNLVCLLEFMGHDVWHLSRNSSGEEKTVIWNPKTGECNLSEFEGFDVVIHLAGENIGKGWWTRRKKRRVLKSRVKGTELLVEVIKKLSHPPQAFISASAVGYYGNCGAKMVNEESGPGKGLFLSEVCQQWEHAGKELEEKGIRVVYTRFGMVLSSEGGALKQMLRLFKWGLGGRMGNGHQYMSWVAIDDVVGALYHVMMTPNLSGAVNVVAPHPVPNDIFTKKLAQVLNRWLGPPFPEFAVRLLMGQKGEELLLSSTRVEPRRLCESGYNFHYPNLYQALEHVT